MLQLKLVYADVRFCKISWYLCAFVLPLYHLICFGHERSWCTVSVDSRKVSLDTFYAQQGYICDTFQVILTSYFATSKD